VQHQVKDYPNWTEMKFAHISDTHLGQYRSKIDRENDTYDAFSQAIAKSIEAKVDFVILSGDIFDKSKPPNKAIVLLMQQLKLLKQKSIETYFILGDHDQPKHSREKPIHSIFKENLANVAHHIGEGDPITFKDSNVLLVGFDHQERGVDVEELKKKFQEIDSVAKEHKGHSILVLHQGITEAHEIAADFNANELPKNFTYYALGDIHAKFEKKYDFLGGPLTYPGPIEISSKDPISEVARGFYIVDISGDEAIPNWIELKLRPRFVIETTPAELHEKINELISKIEPNQKPLLRLIISDFNGWDEIRAETELLNEHFLDWTYKTEKSEQQFPITVADFEDIHEKFRELATKNVGSELAELAFDKIYPATDEKEGISEIIIENYKKFKEGEQKR